MNNNELGKRVGEQLECIFRGVTYNDYIKSSAIVDTCLQSNVIQQSLCKIAKSILTTGDLEDSPEYKLYEVLEAFTKRSSLQPLCVTEFITPVLETLSSMKKDYCEESMSKQASMLPGAIARALGFAGSAFPDAAKQVAAVGALGGAGVGALMFAANRDLGFGNAEDASSVESKEAQANYYRQVARDLQRRVALENKIDRKAKKLIENETNAYAI